MDEMITAINAVTSPTVQVWMNWMVMVFLASILFVWRHVAARYTLGVFVVASLLGVFIFKMTQEPYLLGIAHWLLWAPLAIYLFKSEVRQPKFNPKTVYGIWLILLIVTIVISLVFDIRDIVLVLLDKK